MPFIVSCSYSKTNGPLQSNQWYGDCHRQPDFSVGI